MSKGQALRDLVMERLVVAADEIFALFERTIAEYEEEALRSRLQLQEPRAVLHKEDIPNISVHPEVGTSPEHMEEEQGLCVKQEEEAPLEFPFSPFSVKTEDNVDTSSLLQQDPAEENREDTVREPCEGEEPGCSLDLPSENMEQTYNSFDTDDSEDWEPSAKRSTKCAGQGLIKDSKRGVQTHLVSPEVGPGLLQQRPTEENREEPLGEQYGEEKPGCSSDLINPQSNSGTHCSSGTSEWGYPAKGWIATATKRQNSNLRHTKDSKRGRAAPNASVFLKCGTMSSMESLLMSGNVMLNYDLCDEERKTKHECSECGEAFQGEEYLQNHMVIHSSQSPFRCPMCNKVFRYKSSYKTHLSVHTEEKPLSCSFCNKGFRQKYNLKEHMRIHTDEKPFCCPDCGVRFRHQHNLFRHILTVHKGEKPYSCPICEKAFSQKSHFNIHMRTHTGEKPFSCSICNKSFGAKFCLKRHIRTHRVHADAQTEVKIESNIS